MARLIASLCLAFLTMFGSSASGATAAAIESIGIPAGFNELTRDRDIVVDVYVGRQKVTAARVAVRPGFLRFKDPQQVLSLIPNVEVSSELATAFASEFPTNTGLVCPEGITQRCGDIAPQVAGLIFDEDNFRIDLFINSKWLRLIRPEKTPYLPAPTAPLSLTNNSGLALSGATGTSFNYNLQNRTIIAFRDARVRTDLSYASKFGFLADTMVAEVDRPGLRYSAGLFWAPGLDLTGQRRIVGVGIGTQFDTRMDHERLQGTPLVLFLAEPSQVDTLIDGRLVTSQAYEAGNNIVDTSYLPNGSYPVVLRIHAANGNTREERHFFSKSAQIPPSAHPIFFGYAGMLANTRRGRPISVSKDLFYQFGFARRLSRDVAVDLSVTGTQKKPLLEVGGWFLTSIGRARAAAIISARGEDQGALLQVESSQRGRLSLNFDLRRIWNHDGKPLVPVSSHVDTFESKPLDGWQASNGSYTQASGSIGYSFGSAYVAVIGSLRKEKGRPLDYNIGPNLNWSIVNRNGLQVALQADAQATRGTRAGYVGLRMLYTGGPFAITHTIGERGLARSRSTGGSKSREVGDLAAHFSYADEAGTDLSLAGGMTRELDSSNAHGEALLHTRLGSARGEIIHSMEGANRTQFGLTLQTGAVLNRDEMVLGAQQAEQSAMLISIDGASDGTEFEVLINDQPRGRVRTGGRLPIFLAPYRKYSVRLRPVRAASVWYDSGSRNFTLYPGNVQTVRWQVEHLLTVFGRAVRPDGRAVQNATITSRRGVGQSTANGYFQIETSENDTLTFKGGEEPACTVAVGHMNAQLDYARLGKVLCQ